MTGSMPTIDGLRHAIETRNADSLKSFYAEDAVLTIEQDVGLRQAFQVGHQFGQHFPLEIEHRQSIEQIFRERVGGEFTQGRKADIGISNKLVELFDFDSGPLILTLSLLLLAPNAGHPRCLCEMAMAAGLFQGLAT